MTCKGSESKSFCRYVFFLIFLALLGPQLVGATQAEAQTVTASVKKPYSISLPANPTTGYQWDAKFDKNFVELKAKNFVRDSSKPKKFVGVGGTTAFTFVPLKAGETTIELQYKRPWEKEVLRSKTLRLTIVP